MYRGGLSIRKLGVLATQLPPGAAIYHSEGSDLSWSTEGHFMRLLIGQLSHVIWRMDKRKGGKPEMLPTPRAIREQADKAAAENGRADAAMRRHIARMKAKKASD